MVSQILTLLALTTATPATQPGGASAEARATATIQRGVIVGTGRTDATQPDLPPTREARRACDPAASAVPQCRLVILDLP